MLKKDLILQCVFFSQQTWLQQHTTQTVNTVLLCSGNKCQNDLLTGSAKLFPVCLRRNQWCNENIDLKIQCKDTEFFIRQDFQLAYLRSKFRQPCHLAIQSRECMNSITLHKYRLKKLLKTMQSLTYTRKEVYKCFKTPRKLLIQQCQEKLTKLQ